MVLPFILLGLCALPACAASSLITVDYRHLVSRGDLAYDTLVFAVVRVQEGAKVLTGTATGPVSNSDTQEELHTADFSALKEAGEYQLEAPGAGKSTAFRVAADLYRQPFHTVARAMYLWRHPGGPEAPRYPSTTL